MSDIKYADIRVHLTGTSGSDFIEEATGGRAYDDLLQTVMRWIAVSQQPPGLLPALLVAQPRTRLGSDPGIGTVILRERE